jgi:hypothetical protein
MVTENKIPRSQQPLPVRIRSQINPTHAPIQPTPQSSPRPNLFSKIHFNIVLPSTPVFQVNFSFKFPNQNSVRMFSLPNMYTRSCPSQLASRYRNFIIFVYWINSGRQQQR